MLKKLAIRTLKGLAWLALAILLLALAWLASNNRWVDARSDAVPAALQRPAAILPDERNGFFALIGMDAPEGADPAQVGRLRWASDKLNQPESDRLRWPQPQPGDAASSWNCRSRDEDCTARWREHSQALRALINQHATLGHRCEALAAPGFVMDELLREPLAEIKEPSDQYAARIIPQLTGIGQCARWLRLQAVLAQQRGDPTALGVALQRSQTLVNGLLVGSRSLTGSAIAWRLAEDHWRMMVALAAREPALTAELIRLAEPLPPEATDASRWIVSEAFSVRQVVGELALNCREGGLSFSSLSWMDRHLNCVGIMPRANQQLLDQQWLRTLEVARAGPLAALAWQPEPQQKWLFGFAWYNTIGHILMDVAQPGYTDYFRRQADLLLHHQAALLALQAAAQLPDQRAAWLAQQPMDQMLRARILLDGTQQIVVSPWSKQDPAAKPTVYPIAQVQDS